MVCAIGTLSACYSDASPSEYAEADSTETPTVELSEAEKILLEAQQDSISFFSKRNYTVGYNFIVYDDSISLLLQQPEELLSELEIDTFSVYEDHQLVVGNIRVIPQDSVDSVWVQVATDEGAFGWIHEKDLLKGVVPVDPISQFIMFFSSSHIIISLILLAIIIGTYLVRKSYKKEAPLVHFRDISTFYPTLLCLIVATSATGYASLQMFAPQTWQHYFFHPTLNPLKMPFILGVFISSVWAMLIVGIAVIDEIRRRLSFEDAILYIGSLITVCSINYIIFSISTLYYVGYSLLIAYYYFALKRYFMQRNRYICGNCGFHFRDKGKCPNCGVINY